TSTPPSLTAPLPQLAQLQQAAAQIQSPTHDPALKIAWCRDVFFLLDRAQGCPTDPIVGPLNTAGVDPALVRLAEAAAPMVLQLATSWSPPPQTPGAGKAQMPAPVAEAIYLRATLAATGAFPACVRHNPRTAFRDFEAAARGGFPAAWFRLGRDYENFNDHARARDCFERGAKMGVESCVYRMGMAHLLGQLSLPPSPSTALPLLHRAALLASLTTPQPAYVYALLLLSEFTLLPTPLPPSLFSSLSSLPTPASPAKPLIPPGSSPTLEARAHLERAAFLHFPAAQYKLGHAYEFAEPPFPFDPLMSVQYYSLASQQGEGEADMALSKWFLCGSGGAALAGKGGGGGGGQGQGSTEGGFEKDEALALTFAEKAARKGLASAEFAMGYYAEVGVGQPRDVGKAIAWYERAASHANPDAPARLRALTAAAPAALSRAEHDALTETKLMRRRTMAARRAEEEPVSPPWEGRVFPSIAEASQREYAMGSGGGGGGGGQGQGQRQDSMGMGVGGQGQQQQQQGRRRQDGRMVVDVIRKNSLAYAASPGGAGGGMSAPASTPTIAQGGVMQSVPVGGRMGPSQSQSHSSSLGGGYPPGQGQGQGQGYAQGYAQERRGRDGSPARGRYDSASASATPQQQQNQRMASPGRRTQSPGRLPIGGGTSGVPVPVPVPMSASNSSLGSGSGSPGRIGGGGVGPGGGQAGVGAGAGSMGGESRSSKLERMRLHNITTQNGSGSGDGPYPPQSALASSAAATTPTPTPNANGNGKYGNGPSTPSQSPAIRPQATHRPSASLGSGTGGGAGAGDGGKRPQTFAEMGIHGAKVEDKDCIIM
ncbi:hypothetical protein CVT25_012012, partial [Psilocybe cyanescens]